MGLKDIGARLPPGFRFFPNDEELVCHYLYKKIANEEPFKGTLVEIDLHTCEPWQLPEVAKLNTTEWYFFSFRDRKYATGFRTNRATTTGYWKATGKDRVILDPRTHEIVGMRKTLVFYRNRAPNGIKTGWIMHEFRLESPHMPPKEDWVLCRVFFKGKEENNIGNNINYHQNQYNTIMFDQTTASSSSPPPLVASSPPLTNTKNNDHQQQQNHICNCQFQANNSFSSNNNPSSSSALNNPINSAVIDQTNNDNGLNNNNNNNFSSPTSNPTSSHVLNLFRENSSNNFSFSDLINSTGVGAKNDDDFGFLWDMDLGDQTSSKFGDDNGIVFL